MRRSRFTLEEITRALQQSDQGTPAAEIAARMGVSQQTFYRWKRAYAGIPTGNAGELKLLREENLRLKRTIEELREDRRLLQEIAAKKWTGPR